MSFLLGMDIDFFKPQHRPIIVGDITIKDYDTEDRISVTWSVDTGTLFMDGNITPVHFTIGDSLNWYLDDRITDIDIEDLYFDNTDVRGERPAHPWEKRTFLLGHWTQYAKHSIRVRLVIRLGDTDSDFESDKNGSSYFSIGEDQAILELQDEPKPLDIQPFS